MLLNLVTRYGDLDLTFRPAGTGGFADLARQAKQVTILGVGVSVAALEDVIRSKEAADRPKDRRSLPVLRQLLEEIQKMADGPIAADELARAKDSILNSFVFQFDSKEKVLRQQLAYEYYGYPADFLDRYRSAVEKVTAAEAQAAARRHLHRDRLAIVVVGKSSDFGAAGLASFGPVTRLDVAIPPPPAAVASP